MNRIGGFILVIFISRALKPDGFGIYSLAMTISFFFVMFSDFGISHTLIRYVASEIDKNNRKAAAYFKYLLKLKIFITLIMSFILLSISYPLSYFILKKEYLFIPLLILSIYVFFTALCSFFESLFFIRKQVKYFSLKEAIFQSARIFSVLFILSFVALQSRIIGIFVSYLIISVFILIFMIFLSKRLYPPLFEKTSWKINKKKISRFILFVNVQTICLLTLSQAGIILLGIFALEQYVGYFSSALVLTTGISSLLSFSYIFLPILTKIKGLKFNQSLQRIFRFIMSFVIPISFGLALLSRYFIFLLYGRDYLSSAPVLGILSFTIPCAIGADLILISFSSKGKPKRFVKALIYSTLLFLALNLVFIKIFLNVSQESIAIGAALASLIAWLFYFVFSAVLLKKEFNIKILGKWIIKPVLSSLIMSVWIYFLLKMFQDINLFNGLILVFSGMIIYFISLYLMAGMQKEDFALLKILFKKNSSV